MEDLKWEKVYSGQAGETVAAEVEGGKLYWHHKGGNYGLVFVPDVGEVLSAELVSAGPVEDVVPLSKPAKKQGKKRGKRG
ncbi:MAG: hypothetical protein AAFS10_25150 [Myxococcota bacterium]